MMKKEKNQADSNKCPDYSLHPFTQLHSLLYNGELAAYFTCMTSDKVRMWLQRWFKIGILYPVSTECPYCSIERAQSKHRLHWSRTSNHLIHVARKGRAPISHVIKLILKKRQKKKKSLGNDNKEGKRTEGKEGEGGDEDGISERLLQMATLYLTVITRFFFSKCFDV